jgi:hypothetical protein
MVDTIRYRVAYGYSRSELDDQVKTYLEEGFEPIGGIACRTLPETSDYSAEYCQALIKRRD